MLLFVYQLYKKNIVYSNEKNKITNIINKLNYNGYNINSEQYNKLTKNLNGYKLDLYFWIILTLMELIIFYYMVMSIIACYNNIKEKIVHILLLCISTTGYSIISVFNSDCLKRYLNILNINE